ncbi:MAG: hypothetical protein LC808_37305 [Actinobacteria bacterium]|nr:hypothetical protein [Actinomycetota bacterium]MCA1708640.1 hypothetical protein [Actinomycetota bacterium]
MPKRTNLFQDVVAIIQRHMAGHAEVEDSALLKHRQSGEEREVDVVIRTNLAGHEAMVCVEATAPSRKADSTAVEKILAKHDGLPRSTLVIVSQSGFTAPALKTLEARGVVALSPEELEGENPEYKIVSRLRSIWPKTVSLTPEHGKVWVQQPHGLGCFRAPGDLEIHLDDGRYLGLIVDVIKSFIAKNWERTIEQIGLADIAEDFDGYFVFGVGPPTTIQVDGVERHLCLRWLEGDDAFPPGLHPIEKIDVWGKAVIRISEVPLTHKRLGEVEYAFGTGRFGDGDALVVVTEGEEGGKLTLRSQPERKSNRAERRQRKKKPQ